MSTKEIIRLQKIKDKSDLEDEQNQIRAMKKPLHFYDKPTFINYDDEATNAARQADEYDLINMRASIAAIPKGLTNTMNKKLNRPTEEMIKQYNQEHQRRPYVDPETGKIYKYHPVEGLPILEQVSEEDLDPVYTEEQIALGDEELRSTSLEEIPQLEEDIKDITEREDTIIREINEVPTYPSEHEIELNHDMYYKSGISPKLSERQRMRDEIERIKEQLNHSLENLENLKYEKKQRIEQLIQKIANYEHRKQISRDNRLSNEAKINLVQQQNKQKLKAYKEQLNILNSGSFNMEQMPYETDEEFKERLIAHSQIEAPAEVLYDATVYASKEIRNKLKELIRNDIIIDLIANQMSPQEKYLVMKQWGAYKKKFIETLGEYNPAMSINDLVLFFISPIGSEEQKNIIKSLDDEVLQNEAVGALVEDIMEHELPEEQLRAQPFQVSQTDDNSIEIKLRKKEVLPFFIKIIRKGELYQIAVSLEDKENSFRAVNKSQLNNFLQRQCGYSQQDITLFSETFGDGVKELKETFLSSDLIEKPYNINSVLSKRLTNNEGKEYTGWGIQHDKIPEWAPFGSILINLKKLFYENLLSIKSHAHHAISGFVLVKVSDKFVKIIMDLSKGKNIHYREIEELPRTEQLLYDHLIAVAKLHKKLDHRIDSSVKELKNRYEILVGEIESGNDNPELIKELKIVVNKLVSLKVFTQNQANSFLKML